MEPIFKHDFPITDIYLDSHGRLKPSAILYFVQEAAGQHCNLLRVDWDTLSHQNLFWAVTRHRVQITRLPTRGETITVETWPMPTTKVAFPRSVVAYDESGKEVFRAISIWVLMDTRTRAMILPGKSGVLVEGALRGNELTVPRTILPAVLHNTECRTVRYTQLDRNGHMNNTRYLDWVEDLLPSAFHKEHPVREISVSYHAEAREGQEITLSWDMAEGPVLQVDAHREKTGVPGEKERVFSAKIEF